jgi:hypothetical protein
MTQHLEISLFTDPACPFAFSAEPIRWRLRWHYGDQLHWRTRMIVLTLEPGEAERLAEGASRLQRTYGMPIDPARMRDPPRLSPHAGRWSRPASTRRQPRSRYSGGCASGRCSVGWSTIRS